MSNTTVTSSYEITAKADVSVAIVSASLISFIWETCERDADERAATGDEFVGERMFDELFDHYHGNHWSFNDFTGSVLSAFDSSFEVGPSGTLFIKGDSESVGGFSPEEARGAACIVGRLFSVESIRVSVSVEDSKSGGLTYSSNIDYNGLDVDEAPKYKFAA